MQFSFCIITKNEEKNIENCLKPIAGLGMEIVVVDTGSADKTKEIAAKYTDKIYDFEWINDFSAAKNYAMKCASNNFVFILDADEFSENINVKELELNAAKHPTALGRIIRRNKCHSDKGDCIYIDKVERFFDKRLYTYKGAIHEQITSIQNKPLVSYEVNWSLYHEGYYLSPSKLKEKGLRNASLLLKELEKDPLDIYTLFQLGQSYTLFNDYESALPYYEKAVSLISDTAPEYIEMLVTNYGQTLIHLNQNDKAAQLSKQFSIFEDYSDYVFMIATSYMQNKDLVNAIKYYKKAISSTKCQTEGTNSFTAYHNLGCIYEALGNYYDAIKYYEKALPYPASKERLKSLNALIKNGEIDISTPLLSLIIVNNSDDIYLSELFNSLREQTISISSLEIILLNNNSNSKCIKLMEAFEKEFSDNVILLPGETNTSLTQCLPNAYSYSSCEKVLFITDNLIPQPDTLRLLIRASETGNYDLIKCNTIDFPTPKTDADFEKLSIIADSINTSLISPIAYPVAMTEILKDELQKKRLFSKPLNAAIFKCDFISSKVCFSLDYCEDNKTYLERDLYENVSSLFIIENICFIRFS